MTYKILVVEDDRIIADKICEYLNSFGYEARPAEDFSNVMAQFAVFSPHLVMMDISLPFYNGYYWCSEIRKISKVPVIFISSANDNMNVVMAVNYGADDFIAKPFDLTVLTAKIQAVLRRTYDFGGQTSLLEHRGVILNMDNASLVYNDVHVELTKNEYRILRILMENKGKTVKRDTIMTILWESDSFVDDNTLTVNVTRLRKKLEQAGLPDFIATKKGIGYLVE
ncbi:MAG: response regulator transcription factor [Eubacteriales bacterium]|nr:response regulator transcription factor [Eubacteriales bacterium]